MFPNEWPSWSTVWWGLLVLGVLLCLGGLFGAIAALFNPTKEAD